MEKNPFASSGIDVAARAARRSSQLPANRSSTSTDIARAPARSYAVATEPTSPPGRSSPAEGERRLNSAIAPNPGASNASRNLKPRRLGRRTPVSDTGQWPFRHGGLQGFSQFRQEAVTASVWVTGTGTRLSETRLIRPPGVART